MDTNKSSIHFLIFGDDLHNKQQIINSIGNTDKLFDIYIPDVDEPFTQYIYKNCIFTICPFSADIYQNINNDIFKNIYGIILCYNDKTIVKDINILYSYTKLFNCRYKININFSSNKDTLLNFYNFYYYNLESFLKNIDYIIENKKYEFTPIPSCMIL